MIRSNLCNYSDAHIYIKATTAVSNTVVAVAPISNQNKKVTFKNCAPFTNCMNEISNTQVDDAKDINIVIPMYDLTEYSDVYLKTSEILWQYYRDETALDNKNKILDFPADSNNSILFKFKQ